MSNLLHATPEHLRDAAKSFAKHDIGHWSELSIVLGRVEVEGLWLNWGAASARAWAESELGVPPRDYMTAIDLWHTMQLQSDKLPIEQWAKVSKSKALLLRKVFALGADPKQWFEKAVNTGATVMRLEIEKLLGKETWLTFSVAMPEELHKLAEAVLVMALPHALPDEANPDPARTKDRNVRFACLEAVLIHYVQNHADPASQPEAT